MVTHQKLARLLHALSDQAWAKGPHETDAEFSQALIDAGDALGVLGQNIHEDFDPDAFTCDSQALVAAGVAIAEAECERDALRKSLRESEARAAAFRESE